MISRVGVSFLKSTALLLNLLAYLQLKSFWSKREQILFLPSLALATREKFRSAQTSALEVRNTFSIASDVAKPPTSFDADVIIEGPVRFERFSGRLFLQDGHTPTTQTYESQSRFFGISGRVEAAGLLIKSVSLDRVDDLGMPVPGYDYTCNIESQILDD